MFNSRKMENIRIFYLKIFIFLVAKFSVYLNRHVFIMFSSLILPLRFETFFMLNSAEHEIYPANKSQIINTFKLFLAVNIVEHENFSANKYANSNNCLLAEKISC